MLYLTQKRKFKNYPHHYVIISSCFYLLHTDNIETENIITEKLCLILRTILKIKDRNKKSRISATRHLQIFNLVLRVQL